MDSIGSGRRIVPRRQP